MINGYNSYNSFGGGYGFNSPGKPQPNQPSFFPNMPKQEFGKFPNMPVQPYMPNMPGWGKDANGPAKPNAFGGFYGNNLAGNNPGEWTKLPNMNWGKTNEPVFQYPVKQMPKLGW